MVLRVCAAELEEWLQEHLAAELTIAQASAESGYSKEHLRDLVRAGRIKSVKRNGRLYLTRVDLPKKPRRSRDHNEVGAGVEELAGTVADEAPADEIDKLAGEILGLRIPK